MAAVLRSGRVLNMEQTFTYLRECDIKSSGDGETTKLAECPVCYKRLHRHKAIQCLRCQECFHQECLADHDKPFPDMNISAADVRDGRVLHLDGFRPFVIRYHQRDNCPTCRFQDGDVLDELPSKKHQVPAAQRGNWSFYWEP